MNNNDISGGMFVKVTIKTPLLEPFQSDLLIYELSCVGFDGFDELSGTIIAYCSKVLFREETLRNVLPKGTRYKVEII